WLGLFALGGFLVPDDIAPWLAAGTGALLFVAFLILLISGNWTPYLGMVLGAGVALGLGGLVDTPFSREAMHALRALRTSEAGIAQLQTLPFFASAMLL